MLKKIVILCLIIFPITLFSQNKWNITFGTEEFTGLIKKNLPEDLPQKIEQNNEGEYYISGTNNYGDGTPKDGSIGAWIAKFNSEGKFLWYRVGDESFQKCSPDQLVATSDGGSVLSGHESGDAPDYKDDHLIIYKYSKTGELLKKIYYTKTLKAGEHLGELDGSPIFTFINADGNISIIASISVHKTTIKNNILLHCKTLFFQQTFSAVLR